MQGWAEDVLHFWFDHVGPERWYNGNMTLDEECRERFEPLWAALRFEKAIFFLPEPQLALAGVILFDQLPRNMFRKEAAAFSTDPLALSIATQAVEIGHDGKLAPSQKAFLYMPFMHSERIDDQDRSVELFDVLGDAQSLRFALMHRDMIRRFGRFPHRNAILGRETRPNEIDAVNEGIGW